MVGSLILSRRVNHAYDKMDEGNESKEAAKIVVEAIKELQAKNEQNFKDLIAANDKSRREMVQTLQSGSLKEYIEQMADDLEEAKAMLQSIQQSLSESNDSSKNQQLAELSRISAELLTASVVITKMGNDMDEIKETLKEEE
jgi:predicted lipid-binding transport protein (Tim44 family)